MCSQSVNLSSELVAFGLARSISPLLLYCSSATECLFCQIGVSLLRAGATAF